MDDDVCGFWKPNWYHIKSMSSSGHWKWPALNAVTKGISRGNMRKHSSLRNAFASMDHLREQLRGCRRIT